MNIADKTRNYVWRPQATFAHLPRPVKVGFFILSLMLVLFERQCIQGLWSKQGLHVQLSHPFVYPLFVLAPWGFCAWGLLHLGKLASRNVIEIESVRLVGECLIGAAGFSYLLAWQWATLSVALARLGN